MYLAFCFLVFGFLIFGFTATPFGFLGFLFFVFFLFFWLLALLFAFLDFCFLVLGFYGNVPCVLCDSGPGGRAGRLTLCVFPVPSLIRNENPKKQTSVRELCLN